MSRRLWSRRSSWRSTGSPDLASLTASARSWRINKGGSAMRWVRFSKDDAVSYGSLANGVITEINGEPWGNAKPTGRILALADVKLEVPVIPRTFYCAGINYAAHIREMAHKRGVEPVFPGEGRYRLPRQQRPDRARRKCGDPAPRAAESKLRGRTGRGHRQAGQAPDRGRRDVLRVRLHHRQRCQRAHLAARRSHLLARQEHRHVQADGAVDRNRCRSGCDGNDHPGQWQGRPALQNQRHDLRHRAITSRR